MSELINALAGDALHNRDYFRVTFEESLIASLMHGLETRTGFDSSYFLAELSAFRATIGRGQLEGAAYLTPLNGVETIAGDRVAVFDVEVFSPPPGTTVGAMLNALNGADGLTVRSVRRIQASDVTAASRAGVKAQEQQHAEQEGVLDRLFRLLKSFGVAVLAIVAIAVAVLAYKWGKELAPS